MSKSFLPRFFVAALIVVACAALPLTLFASHWWGGYHWARTTDTPFTLQLGNNLSGAWASGGYLTTASNDWSKSVQLDTVVVAGQAGTKQCRPPAGRVEVCGAKYGYNGWLGVATIWTSGKHITQASVKLNDSYFNSGTYNTPAWRQMVVCQEVGHTFGLDHQDTTFDNYNLGTCMDYTNAPAGGWVGGTNYGPSNEHPNSHDYDELDNVIYTHADGFTTVGSATSIAMPPAMNQLDLEGPGQWGPVVRGSRAQGFTVHELDFGGGHKITTFVTWVSERHVRQ